MTDYSVCARVSVCLSVFVSPSLLLPSTAGRTQTSNYECKIDQAYITDWMAFLPSHLTEEVNYNPEVLSGNTESLQPAWSR